MRFFHSPGLIAPGILILLGLLSCRNEQSPPEVTSSTVSWEEKYLEDYESPDFLWGFIDRAGHWAVMPRYDAVGSFSGGLAAVNSGGYWGYIDPEGTWAIDPAYAGAWAFHNGLARVLGFDRRYYFLRKNASRLNDRGFSDAYDFDDTATWVMQDGFWAILSHDGTLLTPFRYTLAGSFRSGVSAALRDGSWHLVDLGGAAIAGPFDAQPTYAGDGYWVVESDGRLGIFHGKKSQLLPTWVSQVEAYQAGVALLTDRDEHWSLWDVESRDVIWKSEDYAYVRPAREGLWIAHAVSGEMVVLDKRGTPRGGFHKTINPFSEGRAVVSRDGFWGYIDTMGDIAITPRFYLAWDFYNGLARVVGNHGMQFIDAYGRTQLRTTSPEVRDFSEGLAPMQKVE